MARRPAFGILLLLLSMTAATASAQPPLRIELVDQPRPVSDAVRQIERHFGRVVTYEDVSYVAAGDVVDVTEKVRRDGRMDRRVLVMRGGDVRFTYQPSGGSTDEQLDDALGQLLAWWNASGQSGEFRLERIGGARHVVPTARRGRDGTVEPYTSPLEARITLPFAERSGIETLEAIGQAISRATGRPIVVSPSPHGNLYHQVRPSVGAQDEPARDVLRRALQGMGRTMSWQMLCEVGERAMCAVNVYRLLEE